MDNALETLLAFNLIKYCIVIAGLLMAYANIRIALIEKTSVYAIMNWGLALMGLYWAGFYIVILISGTGFDIPRQIWIRSPLLLTMSLVAGNAIQSIKRRC